MKKLIFIVFGFAFAAYAQAPFALSFFNQEAEIAALSGLQRVQLDQEVAVSSNPVTQLDARSAFLRSLVLPGWGQRYAGSKLKSKVFLGTEIGLWLFYSGFTFYGNQAEEEYKTWASSHAGIDSNGKEKSYYLNIENYRDIEEFNAAMLRQRNTINYYYDMDANYWSWDSDENWSRFGELRKDADRAFNRATLTLGLVMANHIISAVDAIITVKKQNSNKVAAIDWNLQLGDGVYQPYVNLSLTKQF